MEYMEEKQHMIGNVPKDATLVIECERWKLFHIPKMGNAKWKNYKLVGVLPSAFKSNYWLGVCLADDALAVNKDLVVLRERMPDLLAQWILPAIQKHNVTLR